MKKFLRYNGRHHLWFPQGYKGRWFPQLNPLESTYDGKWRPRLDEPRWLMELRHWLVKTENTTCQGSPAKWELGPDDNRTCSYCGSIHPEDLMKICRKTLTDSSYAVEGTTKSYKVYVRQPNVRNAGEGAIKFYMWHAPSEPSKEDQELFFKASKLSHERIIARFKESA